MAEPLRNHFGERVPRTIADQVGAAWPAFDREAFVRDALAGYDDLGLMDRGRHIARALRSHLPEAYSEALPILLASVGDRPRRTEGDGGMASFLYLPHVQYVELFGLEDFEASMAALHLLTQRFTAEFSVRPFIERYEAETLAVLRKWSRDPNVHVRRLVSEGTRPRLPWAPRLRRFQEDPGPVLALLEGLRDDPEASVRRSVANNLNDIGKDHPDTLVEVAGRWMTDASPERLALVRHALRSLVKQGNPQALELLGYGEAAAIEVVGVRIVPGEVAKGGTVTIAFGVRGTRPGHQRILVDLRVHYVKASGRSSPKVFKLGTADLPAGEVKAFRKRLSLADLSTRRHHPGTHRVEALVNGRAEPLGAFDVSGLDP